MKLQNLFSGFALALLMTLGLAGTAHATNYTSCSNFNNNIPTAPSGNVVINESGACSLNSVSVSNAFTLTAGGAITASSISAAGEVHIEGSSVTTSGAVTSSGNKVYIEATSGNIDVDSINSHGNIQALADTGSATIKVHSSVTGVNGFQIFVARGNIMLPAVTNNGGDVRIFANKSGTGSSAFKVGDGSTNGVDSIHTNGSSSGNIYITNGPGSAGIEYDGNDLLQVQASAGRAGGVTLDGQVNGKVKLTGSLSVNGSGTNGAGVINIFAPEVVSEGATLNANATAGHQVGTINLTTDKITLHDNLFLNANGNGGYPDYVNLSIFPTGSYSVNAPEDPSKFISFGAFTTTNNPLTITGDAIFDIEANGDNNGIKIFGNPLTIDVSTTIITQQGGNNSTYIAGSDGGSFYTTVSFGGHVLIGENTTSSSQSPSTIEIRATEYIDVTENISLDASSAGDGPGSNINILSSTGTLDLGGSGANFTLNANGGPTGGNAGTITITSTGTDVKINGGDAILANSLYGAGNGGNITITASSLTNPTNASANVQASAIDTGAGGTIAIYTDDATVLGSGSTGVGISADGNLGSISIDADSFVQAAQITAKAVNNSQDGGTVWIHARGDGSVHLMTLKSIDVSADTAGAGGVLTITTDASSGVANLIVAGILKANGGSTSGPAGAINFIQTQNPVGDGLTFADGSRVQTTGALGAGVDITSWGDLKIRSVGANFDAGSSQLIMAAAYSSDLEFLHGSLTGPSILSAVTLEGYNVSLREDSTSAAQLKIHSVLADDELKLELTGPIDLVNENTSSLMTSLSVLMKAANIGTVTSPLRIATNKLTASGGGDVYVENANSGAPLTIDATLSVPNEANGTFSVTTDGHITLGSFGSTGIVSTGNVDVSSSDASATITVLGDVRTISGDIYLSAGGGFGTSCAASTPACVPSFVTVTGTAANIFFNRTAGITVDNAPFNATVHGNSSYVVSLDAGTSGQIVLEAGVLIRSF